jgi:hypothetical protein
LKRENTFPSTSWAVIIAAGRQGDNGEAALDAFLRGYHGPLCHYLAGRYGLPIDRAEDYVQGFVADKIMRQGFLARVDRGKTRRFRHFLLRSFQNYVASALRSEQTLKESPHSANAVPLHSLAELPDDRDRGERDFDLEWARQILSATLRTMREECRGKDHEQVWKVFEKRLLNPALEGAEPVGYEQLVAECDLATPAQAMNALVTAKRAFRRHLRRAVAATVADEREVDDELHELQRALANANAGSGALPRIAGRNDDC